MCEFDKEKSIIPTDDRKLSMYGFSVCENFNEKNYEEESLRKSIKYKNFPPQQEVSLYHLREGNVLWISFSDKEVETPYYVSFLNVEETDCRFGDLEGSLILEPFDKRAKSFATKIYCEERRVWYHNNYNDGYYCRDNDLEGEERFNDTWRNGKMVKPNDMILVPDFTLCKSFSIGEEEFVHLCI